MNITACIITNDNREVLNAIKSVKSSCNEIVLVETSGNNSFVNELNDLGAKLYYKNFNDDFSELRNYSISKATGKYILVIDSDEVMTTEIKYLDDAFDYFMIKIYNRNIFHYEARLFKNDIGIKYRFAVHENIDRSNLTGAVSDIEFTHTGYDSTEDIARKQERNYLILQKNKTHPGYNFYLCNYFFFKVLQGQKNNTSTAIDYGIKSLSDNIGTELKARVCINLYNLLKEKNLNEALKYLSKSLELVPIQSLARLIWVDILEQANIKDELIKELNALLTVTKKNKSYLPNDYFLSETEILNKIQKANLIN